MREFKRSMCAVAGAVLALAGAAQANLLTNPGFEVPPAVGVEYFGAPGWSDFGGGTFTTTSAIVTPNSGDQSLKMFGNPSGVFQTFPASPGELWNGGVWMLNAGIDPINPGQIAAVNIEWLKADSSPSAIIPFISNGTFNAGGAAPVDQWTLLTITGAAPADAAFARLTLITGAFAPGEGPGGGAVWFDDAFFEVIPSPGTMAIFGLGGIAALRRRR
jgi:hypothetical protein